MTEQADEPIVIASYNTSYPLDLHHSLLHPGLSDSAAIIGKAKKIAGNGDPDSINTFEKLVEFDTPLAPESQNPQIAQTLENFRLKLADCISENIKKQLTSDSNKPNVYMCIEQSILVGEGNMAYYGGGNFNGKNHGMERYDLNTEFKYKVPDPAGLIKDKDITRNANEFNNKDYGIFRRIDKINATESPPLLLDCCSETAEQFANKYTQGQKFNIIYDNVVNTAAVGVAEGIAIITDNVKFPLNKMMRWKRNRLPLPTKLGLLDETQVFFYSADLGQIIEDANQVLVNKNPKKETDFIVKKGDGPLVPDMGRPIMLTACLKDDGVLHIFIAVHNLNMPQLRAVNANDTEIWSTQTEIETLEQNVKTTEDQTKQAQMKTKIQELKTQMKGQLNNTYPKIGSAKSSHMTNICKILCEGMGQFITNAFMNNTLTDDVSIANINTVKLYMGGDFNDPRRFLLANLETDGIQFTINGKKFNAKFTFPDFGNTCCANADSVNRPNDQPTLPESTLGPIAKATFDKINTNYLSNFYEGETFAFEGDTVSFAIASNTEHKLINHTVLLGATEDTKKNQPMYTHEKNTEVSVMPSDHYAVMASFSVASQQGGGGKRRNNRNNYSMKRRNVTRKKNPRRTGMVYKSTNSPMKQTTRMRKNRKHKTKKL